MIKEKWQQIVGNIKDGFKVEDDGSEHLDEQGGIDIEYIVFLSPLGKIKLEYVEKPVVLNKKTTYSKRIGSETAVDYVYSQEEKSGQLFAYKWDEALDDWAEIEAKSFVK